VSDGRNVVVSVPFTIIFTILVPITFPIVVTTIVLLAIFIFVLFVWLILLVNVDIDLVHRDGWYRSNAVSVRTFAARDSSDGWGGHNLFFLFPLPIIGIDGGGGRSGGSGSRSDGSGSRSDGSCTTALTALCRVVYSFCMHKGT
jgi:uncharacterized membrane protein YgcG